MPDDIYRTSDLALAAYLMTIGYSIKSIYYERTGKGTFLITDRPERAERVLEFFNRKTSVEPIAFLDQVKSLKAMLNQQ